MKVYFIPGLSGTALMFSKQLAVFGDQAEVLEHIEPLDDKESIYHYARRLAEGIDTSQPFILAGVSMGGILSIEMNKFLEPAHTILIASIQSSEELRPQLRRYHKMSIPKLIQPPVYNAFRKVAYPFIGLRFPKHHEDFYTMFMQHSDKMMRWGMNSVMGWKNTFFPYKLTRIHGSKDHVFPIQYINSNRIDLLIEGGTHFVNIENAEEVNEVIRQCMYKAQGAS